MYAAPTLRNNLDLDTRWLPFDSQDVSLSEVALLCTLILMIYRYYIIFIILYYQLCV